MTLSRITTWVDGQVLTAAALNGEFDNLINNPVTLVFPLPAGSGAINFNYNPIDKFVVGTNTNTTVAGGLSQNVGLLIWNDGSTRSRLMGPNSGLSRVRGLTGSIISNIGSFQADGGYQLQRSVIAGNAGNDLLANVSCTSSFSINTQTAGPIAGGRDQAAAFASTDVHFYACGVYGSTTLVGLCSSTPPPLGPTPIAGSAYWTYLGSAKYDVAASAVTQPWIVRGSRIHPQSSQGELLNIVFDTSERMNITTSSIPQIARNINLLVNYGVQASVGGVNAISSFRIATESSPAGGYPIVWQGALGGVLNGYSYNAQSITLPHTGTVAALTVMSTGLGGLGLMLNHYSVPNGDN